MGPIRSRPGRVEGGGVSFQGALDLGDRVVSSEPAPVRRTPLMAERRTAETAAILNGGAAERTARVWGLWASR
jgi:hypothetical protein